MFVKLCSYLGGVLLISISIVFMVMYSNIFSFGASFLEYLIFIATKVECLCMFLGIILVVYSFKKG